MIPMGYKETRWGWMIYLPQDRYVGRSITEYGEYSPGETRLFRHLLGRGQVVVEAGAHFGSLTMCFAALVGAEGRVVAFEPQPLLAQLVAANATVNQFVQVAVSNAACGEEKGSTKILAVDYTPVNNYGSMSVGEGSLEVPVVAIDDLKLPACRLMKIDVEGAEAAVIRGAEKTIRRCQPVLYVENDRPENHRELIGLIESLGYSCYWHVTPLFDADNFEENPQNVFGEVHSFNALCVPPGARVEGLPPCKPDEPKEIAHA